MRYICALTIAGSDSCGGAGVQADIKTMSALGVYAASAITSITVQNTMGVQAIQAIKPEIVAGQIKAVMDDIKPLAIKIGMVNDKATIQAIADTLKHLGCRPGYGFDKWFDAHAGRRAWRILQRLAPYGNIAHSQHSRSRSAFTYKDKHSGRHGHCSQANIGVRM